MIFHLVVKLLFEYGQNLFFCWNLACIILSTCDRLVPFRPVTSLGHQVRRRVFWEGLKLLTFVQYFQTMSNIFFQWAKPPLGPPWLRACFYCSGGYCPHKFYCGWVLAVTFLGSLLIIPGFHVKSRILSLEICKKNVKVKQQQRKQTISRLKWIHQHHKTSSEHLKLQYSWLT